MLMTDVMLIVSDLKAAILDVGPSDFVPLLLWISWILLLVIACGGADLRDHVTQWSYMAVILAGGCSLLIALPETLLGERSHFENMMLSICFLLAAYVWWNYRSSVVLQDGDQK